MLLGFLGGVERLVQLVVVMVMRRGEDGSAEIGACLTELRGLVVVDGGLDVPYGFLQVMVSIPSLPTQVGVGVLEFAGSHVKAVRVGLGGGTSVAQYGAGWVGDGKQEGCREQGDANWRRRIHLEPLGWIGPDGWRLGIAIKRADPGEVPGKNHAAESETIT